MRESQLYTALTQRLFALADVLSNGEIPEVQFSDEILGVGHVFRGVVALNPRKIQADEVTSETTLLEEAFRVLVHEYGHWLQERTGKLWPVPMSPVDVQDAWDGFAYAREAYEVAYANRANREALIEAEAFAFWFELNYRQYIR